MMAAAQPFISGAISKTVNLPPEATVEDVQEAYMESWKQGLKAVAIYRDGCKRTQPLSTSKTDPGLAKGGTAVAAKPVKNGPPAAVRRKLGDERQSFTHKFSVAGHEGYVHVGLYETGEPGEIFVKMAKEGSTISGLMDSFATAISLALAARRSAAAPVRQVRAHPLRALRVHREPGDPAGQLDHGLPLPLAGREVRAGDAGGRGRAGARRRPRSSSASATWSRPRRRSR